MNAIKRIQQQALHAEAVRSTCAELRGEPFLLPDEWKVFASMSIIAVEAAYRATTEFNFSSMVAMRNVSKFMGDAHRERFWRLAIFMQ